MNPEPACGQSPVWGYVLAWHIYAPPPLGVRRSWPPPNGVSGERGNLVPPLDARAASAPCQTPRGYAAVVDLCLRGSKDQSSHPSASEVSRRVSMYPEGKWAFKIRSGAFGLFCLAREKGLLTPAALCGALPKSRLPGDWPSPG
ncbi:hypothetical protein RF11_11889 [Thelohanellus kitauei]|uniref:Uncharacterized protein n=1 Tax=Thelohanellus kitauei TaxID=669202 RepID=A0A0C2MX03_THEKT|nr:hypothetical protein RF11_11889 [Thelohanellus kitauei]